jgi:hypothetical protein
MLTWIRTNYFLLSFSPFLFSSFPRLGKEKRKTVNWTYTLQCFALRKIKLKKKNKSSRCKAANMMHTTRQDLIFHSKIRLKKVLCRLCNTFSSMNYSIFILHLFFEEIDHLYRMINILKEYRQLFIW